jgi:hypothetical protein
MSRVVTACRGRPFKEVPASADAPNFIYGADTFLSYLDYRTSAVGCCPDRVIREGH